MCRTLSRFKHIMYFSLLLLSSCGLQGSIKTTSQDSTPQGVATSGQPIHVGGDSYSGNILVGTLDSYGFGFLTQGIPRMALTQAGLVGVGTQNPSSLLQVEGNGTTSFVSVNRTNDDDTSNVAFQLMRTRSSATAPGANFGASIDWVLEGANNNTNYLASQIVSAWHLAQTNTTTDRDSYIAFLTSQDGTVDERLRIQPGGNIGVGTTSAGAKIEAVATSSIPAGIFSRQEDDNGSYSTLEIHRKRSSATAPSASGFGAQLTFGLEGFTNDQVVRASKVEGAWENGQSNDTTDRNSFLSFWTMQASTLNENMRLNSYGNLGVGVAPGSVNRLEVNGHVNISTGNALKFNNVTVCTGAGCTAVSDRRYKENIQPIERALERILSIEGVTYDWRSKYRNEFGNKKQIGMIAQDLEKVFPEVVVTDLQTGFKSVMYDHLVAPIIESIKELVKRQDDQMELIQRMRLRLDQLEKENLELRDALVGLKK